MKSKKAKVSLRWAQVDGSPGLDCEELPRPARMQKCILQAENEGR